MIEGIGKIGVVFLCYTLSIVGILGSLLISYLLILEDELKLLFIIISFPIWSTWICHFVMCLQWIFNKPLNRLLITIEIFCGTVSLCLFSVMIMLATNGAFSFLKAIGLCVVLVFPCLYLIIYIIKHNLANKNKQIT